MELVRANRPYIGYDRNIPRPDIERGRRLSWEYNHTSPDDHERQCELLKQLLGTYNDEVMIQPDVHFDFGFNTHFLGMAYLNFGVTILDTSPVIIGAHCFIAPGVIISCPSHPVNANQRNEGVELSAPITIGESVWIGAGAIICGGVKIGDRSVIGAGAVVLKDVPSDSVAVGVPARVVRKITDDDRVDPSRIQF